MTYWYEVGVHPTPTEDDLPVIVQRASIGAIRARPVVFDSYMPEIVAGDRWTHVTLPTETAPPPEEEGVEVGGKRYRIGNPEGTHPDWVFFRRTDSEWMPLAGVVSLGNQARIAIALGLVDPPVPADVQRVVDAAKAWRDRNSYFTANPAERDLITAVDALDSPTPVPADPTDGAERTAPREVPLRLSPLGFTEVAKGTITDDGTMLIEGREVDYDGVDDYADLGEWLTINAAKRSWPPMRPMSELADEHAEKVLIADRCGYEVAWRTSRSQDSLVSRVGWWPLPTVEEEGT